MTNTSHAVFLSYNGEDRAAVEKIAVYLADKASLHPWFDQWALKICVFDNLYLALRKARRGKRSRPGMWLPLNRIWNWNCCSFRRSC
jgi:TIR domain-containing protein